MPISQNPFFQCLRNQQWRPWIIDRRRRRRHIVIVIVVLVLLIVSIVVVVYIVLVVVTVTSYFRPLLYFYYIRYEAIKSSTAHSRDRNRACLQFQGIWQTSASHTLQWKASFQLLNKLTYVVGSLRHYTAINVLWDIWGATVRLAREGSVSMPVLVVQLFHARRPPRGLGEPSREMFTVIGSNCLWSSLRPLHAQTEILSPQWMRRNDCR